MIFFQYLPKSFIIKTERIKLSHSTKGVLISCMRFNTLIKWLIGCEGFYIVSALFQPYNGNRGKKIKPLHVLHVFVFLIIMSVQLYIVLLYSSVYFHSDGDLFCLFGNLRPIWELFTNLEMRPLTVKDCKCWPMLGINGHWAVRDL